MKLEERGSVAVEEKKEKKPREEGIRTRRRAVRAPAEASGPMEKPEFKKEKDLFRRQMARSFPYDIEKQCFVLRHRLLFSRIRIILNLFYQIGFHLSRVF